MGGGWAREGMERDHLPITLPVQEKMGLAATDNVLDVGCGSEWLGRRLAKQVTEGRVVGMDVSDEMIRVARRTSLDFEIFYMLRGKLEKFLGTRCPPTWSGPVQKREKSKRAGQAPPLQEKRNPRG